MKLRVLSDPGVAVVDVSSGDVLVGNVRQDNEPLLEELGAESVTRRTGLNDQSGKNFLRETELKSDRNYSGGSNTERSKSEYI